MRVAFHAGPAPATIVTSTPTISEITTVDGSTAMPPAGSAKPNASNMSFSSCASPMPPKSPAIEAQMPSTSASSVTHVRICRRDAPIVRSSADSRVRWATRIENVLWMLNAATSNAMPAKMTRNVLNALRNSRVEVVDVLRGVGLTGDRLDAVGHHGRDARGELLLRHAVVGAHEDARHLRRVVRDVLLARPRA